MTVGIGESSVGLVSFCGDDGAAAAAAGGGLTAFAGFLSSSVGTANSLSSP